MSVAVRSLIGGAWVTGSDGTLTDTNPARPDEVVATGGRAGASEMATGVRVARIAANDWARLPMSARGAYLTRAAEIIESNAEAWGEELTREEGKTLAEGIGEVRRAAQILRYYGNAADRETGTVYSSPRSSEQILVTRKPLGVVGVVTPFNFPIAIPAWKIAPALVYGNTVVWKPAAAVPLLAFRLAQALTEAGLPDGVLNMILADSAAGEALVDHPDLDAVTFTGSTGVGRKIAGSAAARGVPVQAEMGGKNAAVVLADADLELAVEQVMLGAFRSTGQKCTATSRLVLHESIAEEFLARLTVEVKQLRVGDPLDPDVTTGPVVSAYAQAVDHRRDQSSRRRRRQGCGHRRSAAVGLLRPADSAGTTGEHRTVVRGTLRPGTGGAAGSNNRRRIPLGERGRIRFVRSIVHARPDQCTCRYRRSGRGDPARQFGIGGR